MSKYGDLIQKARKQENKKEGKPESQQGKEQEPDVNLSIKVPLSLRRHWASEAKRQGTSLTAVITEALRQRFGEPS
jgi:predicted HicB family RNase H-like nuclease